MQLGELGRPTGQGLAPIGTIGMQLGELGRLECIWEDWEGPGAGVSPDWDDWNAVGRIGNPQGIRVTGYEKMTHVGYEN